MVHGWGNHAYEVTFAPAALRVVDLLPESSQDRLFGALRTELANGPNARREIRFGPNIVRADVDPGDPDHHVYTATPLSFDGYTAIHRPMTVKEIEQLGGEQDRPALSLGYYVIDLLPAESAFRRWPRLA